MLVAYATHAVPSRVHSFSLMTRSPPVLLVTLAGDAGETKLREGFLRTATHQHFRQARADDSIGAEEQRRSVGHLRG